jgi:hypothetical protein
MTVTVHNNVNGRGYLDMIDNDVVPALQALYQQQRNGAFPRLWWAQDGAPAHRTIAVRNKLLQLFPRRVIGIIQNGQPDRLILPHWTSSYGGT